MKKILSILLATMFCLSIFGCKDNLCVCENKETEVVNDNTDGDQEVYKSEEKKIHRSKGVYGGAWVLEVDVKKDKLISVLSFINWYFTLSFYSQKGNIYEKKITFTPSFSRFIALEVRSSLRDENSNTLLFYTWLKDSNNILISPYDKMSMAYMESLSRLIDQIEEGEIGEIQ